MKDGELMSLFPSELRREMMSLLSFGTSMPEEIRCRIGQPVSIIDRGRSINVTDTMINAEHLDYMLERATNASLHAHEEEIRRGYLFTASGYRIGLCGTLYSHSGITSGIRDLTSVSVRIPRAVPGCADKIFPDLIRGGFQSTLILSPPGLGKTTLLREVIRKLSGSGLRVSVADERAEIAGVGRQRLGFDLGPNTDIMTGGRKGESAVMLLRAMNPQILAFDEITEKADLDAIAEAAGCGAALLATAHAKDRTDLQRRALYRSIMSIGIFMRAIWIRMTDGKRVYVLEDLAQ